MEHTRGLLYYIGVEDRFKNAKGEYSVTFYGDGEVMNTFEGLKGGIVHSQ